MYEGSDYWARDHTVPYQVILDLEAKEKCWYCFYLKLIVRWSWFFSINFNFIQRATHRKSQTALPKHKPLFLKKSKSQVLTGLLTLP